MNPAFLVRRGIVYVLLSVAAFLSVFPFYWMIVGATNNTRFFRLRPEAAPRWIP